MFNAKVKLTPKYKLELLDKKVDVALNGLDAVHSKLLDANKSLQGLIEEEEGRIKEAQANIDEARAIIESNTKVIENIEQFTTPKGNN